MKFIVELANFCPRILTCKDHFVPTSVIETLKAATNKHGYIVMHSEPINKYGGRQHIRSPSTTIASLLLDCAEYPDQTFDEEELKWLEHVHVCHNNHTFDADQLGGTFTFVEDSHVDEEGRYITPPFATVNSLLESYAFDHA